MTAAANVTGSLKPQAIKPRLLSHGPGLQSLVSMIAACCTGDGGVGAMRKLALGGGGEMRQRIVERADAEERSRYDWF
jgi:hypothetical protein